MYFVLICFLIVIAAEENIPGGGGGAEFAFRSPDMGVATRSGGGGGTADIGGGGGGAQGPFVLAKPPPIGGGGGGGGGQWPLVLPPSIGNGGGGGGGPPKPDVPENVPLLDPNDLGNEFVWDSSSWILEWCCATIPLSDVISVSKRVL